MLDKIFQQQPKTKQKKEKDLLRSSFYYFTVNFIWWLYEVNNRRLLNRTIQLYFQIILKYHFENMHWSHCMTLKQKSIWSFRGFLAREMFFTKHVPVAHRNTVISHLIYLKFAFTPVCIAWSGRLLVHKRNLVLITTKSPLYWKLIIGLFKICLI